MSRIKTVQIREHIYLFNDNDEATGYLVLGENKALLIDTMNGFENLKKLVESITPLPLTVVNTHGHWDHIHGNIYFKQAYIHPSDIPLANQFFESPAFLEKTRQLELKPAAFLPITQGDVMDLGGITLEVFEVPGHTQGSIVLLDRKDRILFTGDSIIEQTWMQLPEALPMCDFLKSLEKIKDIRAEFDYILTGHSRNLEDASLCEAHRKAVEEVCNGDTENDVPYTWFGGECLAHPYGEPPRQICYKR
jgi:glyoxylase-like metal-dependent hydrolase (beta-lactamase superfamily II)